MEIKNCPFCGGEARIGYNTDGHFVNCTECLASTNILTNHENTENVLEFRAFSFINTMSTK